MLRELAHLQEQLGDERFAALIYSGNTGKVKDFCDQLLKDTLPTTMTVGGRTYDILGFLEKGETSVVGSTMVERAKKMSAHLGEDDGQHLLDHQSEIPVALRGMVFVFTDWRRPGGPGSVGCVDWGGGRWVLRWIWLDDDWRGGDRVLRCK